MQLLTPITPVGSHWARRSSRCSQRCSHGISRLRVALESHLWRRRRLTRLGSSRRRSDVKFLCGETHPGYIKHAVARRQPHRALPATPPLSRSCYGIFSQHIVYGPPAAFPVDIGYFRDTPRLWGPAVRDLQCSPKSSCRGGRAQYTTRKGRMGDGSGGLGIRPGIRLTTFANPPVVRL